MPSVFYIIYKIIYYMLVTHYILYIKISNMKRVVKNLNLVLIFHEHGIEIII